MGRSIEAKLVYGFYVDEAHWDWERRGDYPWEKGDGYWWRTIKGFINPHPNPLDEDGNYAPGHDADSARPWWDAASDWDEANPTPWEYEFAGSVYHGSDDSRFFAVAGAPKVRSVWGMEPVDLAALVLDREADANAETLRALMVEHDIPMHPMGWYLLAYEG